MAEYLGLAAAMQKAVDNVHLHQRIVFEVDAIIVAEQVRVFGRNKYACKKPRLRPLFLRCVNLGRELHGLGCQWSIRHIYREYNQVADSLANQAIDQGSCDWIRVN